MRYDINVVNGIKNVVKEHKITDIVLGLRKESAISNTFLGELAEGVLAKCATTTLVYRPVQPLATVKRYIMLIPADAEKEVGFPYWLVRVWNLARNSGSKILFYGNRTVLSILQEVKAKHNVNAEFIEFTDWDDFLIISRDIHDDDALVVVMSRRNCPSYSRQMALIPTYMNKYFQTNNCVLVYPVQLGIGEDEMSSFRTLSMINHPEGQDLGSVLGRLFKRNK